MIDSLERFLRYICGSISCSCRSSCVDNCKHDNCNCACLKKDNSHNKDKEIKNKSLKEIPHSNSESVVCNKPV